MSGRAISIRLAAPWLALVAGAMLLAACEADRTGTAAATRGPANLVPGSPPPPPTPRTFDPGTYKVGNAYQVEGEWYYPRVDLTYEERGIASWYGPNFHGKKTANGEVFDMNLVSAAHKTLPMPSVVRVTNLENGRSLIIRINDRGPFVRGRIIDLSRHAAELLGFSNKGTAMVHVRLLFEESRQAALEAGATGKDMLAYGPLAPKASPSIPVSVEALAPVEGVAVAMPLAQPSPSVAAAPRETVSGSALPPPYGAMTAVAADGGEQQQRTAPAASKEAATAPIVVATLPTREQVEVLPVNDRPSIFIQAGAFREYVNANRLRARLTSLGHPVNVSQIYVTNQPFFRVRLGPLPNVEDADTALERVVALGYPEARIIVD